MENKEKSNDPMSSMLEISLITSSIIVHYQNLSKLESEGKKIVMNILKLWNYFV